MMTTEGKISNKELHLFLFPYSIALRVTPLNFMQVTTLQRTKTGTKLEMLPVNVADNIVAHRFPAPHASHGIVAADEVLLEMVPS